MRVKAVKQGYYDLKRRNVGATFEIKPQEFSKTWMAKVDGSGEEAEVKVSKSAKQRQSEKLEAQKSNSEEDVI